MLDQKNRLIGKLIDTKICSQRDTKTAKQRKTPIDTKRDRKIDTCMHIYIYTYLLTYLNTHVERDSQMGQRGSPSQGSSFGLIGPIDQFHGRKCGVCVAGPFPGQDWYQSHSSMEEELSRLSEGLIVL